jgi:hypothetical protein
VHDSPEPYMVQGVMNYAPLVENAKRLAYNVN